MIYCTVEPLKWEVLFLKQYPTNFQIGYLITEVMTCWNPWRRLQGGSGALQRGFKFFDRDGSGATRSPPFRILDISCNI